MRALTAAPAAFGNATGCQMRTREKPDGCGQAGGEQAGEQRLRNDQRRATELEGQPLHSSTTEQPPLIRRTEVATFSLVCLLIIATVAVLYVGRAFFLPVVTAMIVGTMLSPAAKFMEGYRIPRPVSAVLIVATTLAVVAFMIGLIAAPLMEWTNRLPELGAILRDRLHVFDRPLALWHQLQALFGQTPSADSSFEFPKISWVQPTLEFLSPTFTELLLFLAVLVLFIASWPDLRRALIMNFPNRDTRLRTLRMLNAIEANLGGYLLTVTLINLGVGIATGIVCAVAGTPSPAGLGALAAALNFIPIIGPIFMFVVLLAVGIITSKTLILGLAAPLGFMIVTFLEGHFITPAIIGRRLALNALAVFIALAFWAWLWGPMGAFLSSPLLIVGLIVWEHLMPPPSEPQMPDE